MIEIVLKSKTAKVEVFYVQKLATVILGLSSSIRSLSMWRSLCSEDAAIQHYLVVSFISAIKLCLFHQIYAFNVPNCFHRCVWLSGLLKKLQTSLGRECLKSWQACFSFFASGRAGVGISRGRTCVYHRVSASIDALTYRKALWSLWCSLQFTRPYL